MIKNIDISIGHNSLITAENMETTEGDPDKSKKYYKKGITYKSFTRSTNFPSIIEVSKIESKFKNGILKITLPETEDDKSKKIHIKVD